MDDKIERLADDFENERGPFAKAEFPEARLVEHFGEESAAEYLSAFCTLDYNRSVDQLVDNLMELAEVDDGYGTDYFDPSDVAAIPLDELQAVFTSIGFRYGNRDAKGWRDNCITVDKYFGGTWEKVHAASGYDAPTLVRLLRKEGFKYIKGKKLAPFYCRVIDDFVHPLDDVWALDIPVDVHVRRLSRDLFQDPDMSDDAIRQRWRETGQTCNISPAVVDGGLWQIGYNWDDWGKDYWEAL